MGELLSAVASWHSFVLVLILFGFAPGFCLRLIVLTYPRGNPRRKELIAELYAVPRIQRPLWVAEQLEVALFEGLGVRLSAVIRRDSNRRRIYRGLLALTFTVTSITAEWLGPTSAGIAFAVVSAGGTALCVSLRTSRSSQPL